MKIAVGFILLLAGTICAEQTASVWDGIYAEGQASRGKAVFGQMCATCHGESLKGKQGGAPPLSGPAFKENWNGLTAGDLFEYIKTSMPRYDAGKLSVEQTADIVAYLLTFNGFPAGQKELPNDVAVLKTIRFEADKPR